MSKAALASRQKGNGVQKILKNRNNLVIAPSFKSVGVSLLGWGHAAAAANAPPLEDESQTISGAYRVNAPVRTRPHQHSCTFAGPQRHARTRPARTHACSNAALPQLLLCRGHAMPCPCALPLASISHFFSDLQSHGKFSEGADRYLQVTYPAVLRPCSYPSHSCSPRLCYRLLACEYMKG